jgi:hypothetical protein
LRRRQNFFSAMRADETTVGFVFGKHVSFHLLETEEEQQARTQC